VHTLNYTFLYLLSVVSSTCRQHGEFFWEGQNELNSGDPNKYYKICQILFLKFPLEIIKLEND
jgi:hypothetical protein